MSLQSKYDCMLGTRRHTALEIEIMNLQQAMHSGLDTIARQIERGEIEPNGTNIRARPAPRRVRSARQIQRLGPPPRPWWEE